MKVTKGFCGRCRKRDECTEICEKIEDYVNQDYIPVEEGLITIYLENYDRRDAFGNDKWIIPNFDNSSVLKAAIILLWKDGKSTRKIAELVPCSQQYISKVIVEYRENDNLSS